MTQQEIIERNNQIVLMRGLSENDFAPEDLHFHSDWNWLMTAAKFMLDIVSENDDMETWYSFTDQLPDIKASFIVLSDFAKEYNNQKL